MIFNPLPKLLRELREKAGLSRAKAADAAKVTQTSWSDWEKGKYRPHPRRMDAIARAVRLAPPEFHRLLALALAEHYGLLERRDGTNTSLSKLERLSRLDLEQVPPQIRTPLQRLITSTASSFVQIESMINELEELHRQFAKDGS